MYQYSLFNGFVQTQHHGVLDLLGTIELEENRFSIRQILLVIFSNNID